MNPRQARSDAALREQVTLEFRRNGLMPALAGSHSRHFARLEQRLGVKISMRGNLIAIEGGSDAREGAAHVLRALYQRLEAGEEIGSADVDSELAFAQSESHTAERGTLALRTGPGKVVRPRNAAQADYIRAMATHDLVFGVGPAGTGKTYLAAAYGAHLLHERRVDRLILSRPALEAGERLGFLPGDLREKIDPYLRPLYDALFDCVGERSLKLMETGIIEVAPLAFMRGRTLSRAFVILDEAQNCTPAQMKMFLTRLGEDSRMVVTGDPSQSDLPSGAQGLTEALFYLDRVEGAAILRFNEGDVVRHPLVTRIVAAYGAHENAARAKKTRRTERE